MSHQSSRRQKISFIGLFIRPEVNLDWTKLDKNWPDWTRQKDLQLGQIWPSIKNDQNHPKLVFPPKTVNCKIEFLNGPMVDQIDPKWIKIFPKKSPKPFLRPNTWSCSAPFDRNNLKSWLLIYVHLKVTFQLQEISPKFLFSVLLVPRPTGSGPLIPDYKFRRIQMKVISPMLIAIDN